MQPKTKFIDGLSLATAGILTLGTVGTAGAPFGLADPAFNSPQFTSRAYPIYCRTDGRGGLLWSFETYYPSDFDGADGVRLGGLVRTTVDGVSDTNFVVGPALRETAGTALQADGNILVGGRLAGDVAANGAPNYRVFRYLTNGVLDTTYQSPVFAGPPRFMTVQADGRLLAAWTDLSGVAEANGGISGLVRLNTNGSLDSTFQSPDLGGGFYGVFGPPVVDTNGMIYIVGGFRFANGQSRLGVARLQADGTLDSGFVPAGFAPTTVRSLLVQPGGKVVIAGMLKVSPPPTPGGPSVCYPLMRLNSDGSLDTSFSLVPCDTLGFSRARLLLPAAGAIQFRSCRRTCVRLKHCRHSWDGRSHDRRRSGC